MTTRDLWKAACIVFACVLVMGLVVASCGQSTYRQGYQHVGRGR